MEKDAHLPIRNLATMEILAMSSSKATQLTVLRLLFDSSPIATALSRCSDGTFVEVNEAFLQLYGYMRDEVIGCSSAQLMLWHNPEARTQLLKTLKQNGIVDNVTIQWRHKSGRAGIAVLNARIIIMDGESFMASFLNDVRRTPTIFMPPFSMNCQMALLSVACSIKKAYR